MQVSLQILEVNEVTLTIKVKSVVDILLCFVCGGDVDQSHVIRSLPILVTLVVEQHGVVVLHNSSVAQVEDVYETVQEAAKDVKLIEDLQIVHWFSAVILKFRGVLGLQSQNV